MDSTLGKTEGSTRGSTGWIKNMGLAHIYGLMEENMSASGSIANDMVREK